MSVQGLACILMFMYHYTNNSDVLSFILELPATFFGFNLFKELDQSLDLIYLLALSPKAFN